MREYVFVFAKVIYYTYFFLYKSNAVIIVGWKVKIFIYKRNIVIIGGWCFYCL